MENHGFIKVASVIPNVRIADCQFNVNGIEKYIEKADKQGVSVVTFPELSITGYTCADLFGQPALIDEALCELLRLVEKSRSYSVVSIVGLPLAVSNQLYNCAVMFGHGKIYGIVPKSYIPNYTEFYEARWFSSGKDIANQEIEIAGQKVPFGSDLLFGTGNVVVGIELCEDVWVPLPPSSKQAMAGANVLVNLSATDEMVGKHDYLRSLIAQQSARTMSAYVYSSAGFGESTTDLVFAGNAMVAENGVFVAESERFSFDSQWVVADVDIEKLMTLRRRTTTFAAAENAVFRRINVPFRVDTEQFEITRSFNPLPFIPQDENTMRQRCEEIFNIQVNGLAQRVLASHSKTAVVGISGGLDSTLALLVTVRTFDKLKRSRTDIIGITMPGFGTTGRTYNNAVNLMHALGVTVREISIKEACVQHFSDIQLDAADRSVTYENSQARERTQILMDVANQSGGMVIGTGDLSELALGWATYNGDHMSMYGVNGSVPKTLVRYLVHWYAEAEASSEARPYLLDIIDTPISPELLPADNQGNIAQKTEDLVGPYELHDFFLYHFVRFGFRPAKLSFMAQRAFEGKYDKETIQKWLTTFMRRFFNQQFKRSALPDGPKVGSVSLSPRGDWRMPSDATQGECFKC